MLVLLPLLLISSPLDQTIYLYTCKTVEIDIATPIERCYTLISTQLRTQLRVYFIIMYYQPSCRNYARGNTSRTTRNRKHWMIYGITWTTISTSKVCFGSIAIKEYKANTLFFEAKGLPKRKFRRRLTWAEKHHEFNYEFQHSIYWTVYGSSYFKNEVISGRKI